MVALTSILSDTSIHCEATYTGLAYLVMCVLTPQLLLLLVYWVYRSLYRIRLCRQLSLTSCGLRVFINAVLMVYLLIMLLTVWFQMTFCQKVKMKLVCCRKIQNLMKMQKTYTPNSGFKQMTRRYSPCLSAALSVDKRLQRVSSWHSMWANTECWRSGIIVRLAGGLRTSVMSVERCWAVRSSWWSTSAFILERNRTAASIADVVLLGVTPWSSTIRCTSDRPISAHCAAKPSHRSNSRRSTRDDIRWVVSSAAICVIPSSCHDLHCRDTCRPMSTENLSAAKTVAHSSDVKITYISM